MAEFKMTTNQLTEVDLGLALTTVADPNRIVSTNENGYLQTSDISYTQLAALVSSGVLTANNGLSVDTLSVQLGGTLIKDTTIDTAGFQFIVGSEVGVLPSQLEMVTNTFFNYSRFVVDTGTGFFDGAGIYIDFSGAKIQSNASRYISPSTSNTQPIYVNDSFGSIGMRYTADYSANNTSEPRWIPDKAYVDSVAGSIDESNIVHKSGAEDITGTKTWTNGVNTIVVAPTSITANVGDATSVTSPSSYKTIYDLAGSVWSGEYGRENIRYNMPAGATMLISRPASITGSRSIFYPDASGTVEVAYEYAIPALDIDFNAGSIQTKTIAANSTFTFSNDGSAKSVQVVITNSSGGAVTVGFTGATMPVGATLSIAAGATSVYSFIVASSTIRGAEIHY